MGRLLVYPGSFNPIHIGHIMTAQHALEIGPPNAFSGVIFVPAMQNPFKSKEEAAPYATRLAWVEDVVKKLPSMEVSDIEGRLAEEGYAENGIVYTYLMLLALANEYPLDDLYLLMGDDVFFQLHKWSHVDILLRNFPLVVNRRDGSDLVDMRCHAHDLSERYIVSPQYEAINLPKYPVSASDIRWRVRHNTSISYLVPSQIEEDIWRVYRDMFSF